MTSADRIEASFAISQQTTTDNGAAESVAPADGVFASEQDAAERLCFWQSCSLRSGVWARQTYLGRQENNEKAAHFGAAFLMGQVGVEHAIDPAVFEGEYSRGNTPAAQGSHLRSRSERSRNGVRSLSLRGQKAAISTASSPMGSIEWLRKPLG